MDEHLTKAIHDIGFAIDDIQGCFKTANGVESIVLMDIMERVAKLKTDLDHFQTARSVDNK